MKVSEGISISSRLSTAITSLSGGGKTTFALCQPEEHGEIIYVAADPTSRRLKSVPHEVKDRIHVVTPDGNVQRNAKGEIESTGWLKEAFEIAQKDWKALYPRAGVFVWDTGTETAEEIMRESSVKNWFSEKGPVTGSNNPKIDQAQKYALPQPGDYNMAQQSWILVQNWILAQDMHVIVLFQEGVSDPDPKTGQGLLFGPQTVGGKGPRQVPQKFDENFSIMLDIGKDGKPQRKLQVMPFQNRNCSIKKPINAGGKGAPAIVDFGKAFIDIPESFEGIAEIWRSIVKIREDLMKGAGK